MKRATADKDAHVGDPAFVDVPVGWLTSKELGREYADAIRRGERGRVRKDERGSGVEEHDSRVRGG